MKWAGLGNISGGNNLAMWQIRVGYLEMPYFLILRRIVESDIPRVLAARDWFQSQLISIFRMAVLSLDSTSIFSARPERGEGTKSAGSIAIVTV